MADAATNGKRLVDAALLLALCLRERMGDDKCEVVLFSSPPSGGGVGYLALRNLGHRVLGNVRRCHKAAAQLGRGSEIPVSYLQELTAAGAEFDQLVLLTDGLVAPAKNPANALARWLRSHRATQAQLGSSKPPLKFTCIDVLGLGKPHVGSGGGENDIMISGYSEAVLRYIAQEPGAQLAEVEAIELPPPKAPAAEKKAD